MMREIEIGEPGQAPEAAALSFADFLRWGEVIARVVMTMKAIDGLAVGTGIKLDPVKLRVRGEEFEWSGGEVKRLK